MTLAFAAPGADDSMRGMLLGSIIGDALGTPVDTLGKGHIKAVFRTIEGYVDPEPALKNKMDRWKKPGLYSSLAQLMIVMAACLAYGKKNGISEFERALADMPPVEGSAHAVVRGPGAAERYLLNCVRGQNADAVRHAFPCARPVAIIAPAVALCSRGAEWFTDAMRASLLFTSDITTAAAAVICAGLLRRLGGMAEARGDVDIVRVARDVADAVRREAEENPQCVFECASNPDAFAVAAGRFAEIFGAVESAAGLAGAESLICALAGRDMTNKAAHATVNHPLYVVPYAVFICARFGHDPAGALFAMVSEGGAAAASGCVAGSILGAAYGTGWIPDTLRENLVNRKKLSACIDSLIQGRASFDMVRDFIASEAPLTAKELQERAAREKHNQPKRKKTPSGSEKERRLTQHVVESWTKLDRAKWKKERKKLDRRNDSE